MTMEAIEVAVGCPQSSIHALRDGSITRGILFDATLLPGKATADGWLKPDTPVTWADLEALEEYRGRAGEETRRLHRYEFLFTAAPLRIEQGMGSPINPITTF
ncbi:MAG TPA: hypothetical protein EYM36_00925 [Acidobacteria bacterium]|nr:hypothetical protein [Acidobacteriota bacterium]